MNELWMVAVGAAIAGAVVYFWVNDRVKSERRRIDDMRRHYEELLGQMKNEFKALSEAVLEEKRKQLEKSGLGEISKCTEPLLREVQAFQRRINEVNDADLKRTVELKEKINELVGKTNLVSAEADKLATAIRADAQVTGQWGEIQLKRVLELGGLQPTIDYDYQETFTSPGSNHADLRTDVIVKMPDDRWLVIDAKTTMAAYVDYVGENGAVKAEAANRILESLVVHVKEMKTAEYHKKIESTTGKRILNTMFMYIPFEEVYLLAMKFEIDTQEGKMPLREWAWKNDVVFVNASGLVPIVRMLSKLWALDRSEKKVMEIKTAAEALIEKFRTFLNARDGFLSIGVGLANAVNAYNESLKRISSGPGNLLKRLSDLKDMGVTTANMLPPSEQVEVKSIQEEVKV